ncbi:cation efflux family-domain-containing protein [Scheffersomyces xylosifermentans]|uniref:cation efflux family-domain-containing protein n=1 Tax=Scheffersomyces xylosifermentans TaxID=1304137 RepID=UPI00315D9009
MVVPEENRDETSPLIQRTPDNFAHNQRFRASRSPSSIVRSSNSSPALNKLRYSVPTINHAVDNGEDPHGNGSANLNGPAPTSGGYENISPYHRNSISEVPQRPLFHRLLSNHFTVTNPNSPHENLMLLQNSSLSNLQHNNGSTVFHDNASMYSLDPEQQNRRLSLMNSLRPQRLIGTYKVLANWYDSFVEIDSVKKSCKKYYEDQNYLIMKFQEIDNFLDAGKIHYNMLSNYGNDSGILATHVEVEEPSPTEMSKVDSSNSKFSRFYDVPGNVDNDGSKFLGYDEEADNANVLIAILVNFAVNFVLLIGKIVVALLTNSISVIASLVDSILDFLSTFIIYIVNRLATSSDWKVQYAYPVGRSRLEPLGVLIFSIIIILSFFQVGQESFKRLFMSLPEDRHVVKIGFDAIAIMALTILSKFGCWVWCSSSKSSSVQALAQDAMTDIIFNTVSLLMPAAGYYLNIWWFDPLGALLLSFYIIISWCVTAFEHIDNLTGAAADPLDYKVILYLAYRFAEPIKQITSLKVYHVGDNLNVEIDVVFAYEEFDLSFKDCHDIAEALQYSIESLPMVERAFVHIDYMEGNFKGHLK